MQLRMEEWSPAFKKLKFPHETVRNEEQMNNLLGRMMQKIVQETEIKEPTKDQ